MKSAAWLALFALCTSVAAHGQVIGIVAGGQRYPGYVPQFQYSEPRPKIASWSTPQASNNGPVYPASYNNPDIICHEAATPAAASVPVTAGSTIELQWSPWPQTHHGPIIDYLASCHGPCSGVDKTKLQFNKIDATGLLRESTAAGQAGYWAADKLRDTNNSWTVTIPPTIAPGGYVLRHEIIALHSARVLNGAQNYPHCINLEVTGTGTDGLTQGTLGTELYKETDPGIQIDIYKPLDYTMPGPALHSRRDSAVTRPSGNSTSPYPNTAPIAATATASPPENHAAPQMPESHPSFIAALNTSTRATNLTSRPHPHSDTSPPKIAQAHQSAASLLFRPATPPSPATHPLALPDLSPSPSAPPSHTTPSAASSSPPTPPPTAPSPPQTTSKSKPCTRRIRITKSPLPSPPSTAPPSATSTAPFSPIPPPQTQKQNHALPTAEPPLPSLERMRVKELLAWLEAVVGALGGKVRGGEAG